MDVETDTLNADLDKAVEAIERGKRGEGLAMGELC